MGVFIFTLLPVYSLVMGGCPCTIREHPGCALRAVLNLLEKISQYFNRKMKGGILNKIINLGCLGARNFLTR